MSAFSNLATFHKDTVALEHIAGRLGWDQETMMPSGSIGDRVEEFAALEKILHARRSSSELGTLLERAEAEDLPANELRQVQLIRRTFERTKKVPEDLAIALARLTPKAHKIWVEARAQDDFAIFKPVLAEVVKLTRDLGAALAEGGNGSPYDALLQEYEPDGSSEAISEMFRGLRPPLVDLRSEVLDRSPPPALN
ncbi:MAG: carboxypeptidase M32, partial [Paracoccaceae bacterium]